MAEDGKDFMKMRNNLKKIKEMGVLEENNQQKGFKSQDHKCFLLRGGAPGITVFFGYLGINQNN